MPKEAQHDIPTITHPGEKQEVAYIQVAENVKKHLIREIRQRGTTSDKHQRGVFG